MIHDKQLGSNYSDFAGSEANRFHVNRIDHFGIGSGSRSGSETDLVLRAVQKTMTGGFFVNGGTMRTETEDFTHQKMNQS